MCECVWQGNTSHSMEISVLTKVVTKENSWNAVAIVTRLATTMNIVKKSIQNWEVEHICFLLNTTVSVILERLVVL